MKVCKKCKIEKNENEFHKCKRAKSGLKSECRVCRNIESRNYAKIAYENDPVKFIEKHRKWKNNNKEINKESNRKSCKKSYEKFKEKRKEYSKLYREVYAEEKKQWDKAWRLNNPDKVKINGRKAAENQRKRDKEKVAARLAIMHEIKMERMTRPTQCSICQKECKPEGHHPDYSKPLEVVWLCKSCHIKEHAK